MQLSPLLKLESAYARLPFSKVPRYVSEGVDIEGDGEGDGEGDVVDEDDEVGDGVGVGEGFDTTRIETVVVASR
jgi:hypothetical protein